MLGNKLVVLFAFVAVGFKAVFVFIGLIDERADGFIALFSIIVVSDDVFATFPEPVDTTGRIGVA